MTARSLHNPGTAGNTDGADASSLKSAPIRAGPRFNFDSTIMFRKTLLTASLIGTLVSSSLLAEIVRWDIAKKEPYAEGKPRGEAGPYEQWTGTIHFAIDPQHEAN